jgi:hypothetical protein
MLIADDLSQLRRLHELRVRSAKLAQSLAQRGDPSGSLSILRLEVR